MAIAAQAAGRRPAQAVRRREAACRLRAAHLFTLTAVLPHSAIDIQRRSRTLHVYCRRTPQHMNSKLEKSFENQFENVVFSKYSIQIALKRAISQKVAGGPQTQNDYEMQRLKLLTFETFETWLSTGTGFETHFISGRSFSLRALLVKIKLVTNRITIRLFYSVIFSYSLIITIRLINLRHARFSLLRVIHRFLRYTICWPPISFCVVPSTSIYCIVCPVDL